IHGGQDQTLIAELPIGLLVSGEFIVTNAAAALPEGPAGLGVEFPDFLAAVAIERDDDIGRGAGINQIVDLQRRVLVKTDIAATGAIGPGDLEVPNVVAVDLVEGRIAEARRGAAI